MPVIKDASIESLLRTTRPLCDQVASHGIYKSLQTLDHVRVFMQHHIFAVWDFMCLVKALQAQLTSVSVPWLPTDDSLSRRLINEIVVDEESDDDGQGGYLSHFELYLQAMVECGADISRITAFTEMLGRGEPVLRALRDAEAPAAAQAFVETTWSIVESKSLHRVAAAFAIGREEIVPEMFATVTDNVHGRFPGRLSRFGYYLERHVNIDKDRHAPMATRMLERLCGDDPAKWDEAADAAQTALRARIKLWDDVQREIVRSSPEPLLNYS